MNRYYYICTLCYTKLIDSVKHRTRVYKSVHTRTKQAISSLNYIIKHFNHPIMQLLMYAINAIDSFTTAQFSTDSCLLFRLKNFDIDDRFFFSFFISVRKKEIIFGALEAWLVQNRACRFNSESQHVTTCVVHVSKSLLNKIHLMTS